MDETEIILIVVILGGPAVLFPMLIAYLRTESFRRHFPDAVYQFTLVGHSFLLSKHLLIKIGAIFFLYSWLQMFMPFPVGLIFIAIALLSLRVAEAKVIDANTATE